VRQIGPPCESFGPARVHRNGGPNARGLQPFAETGSLVVAPPQLRRCVGPTSAASAAKSGSIDQGGWGAVFVSVRGGRCPSSARLFRRFPSKRRFLQCLSVGGGQFHWPDVDDHFLYLAREFIVAFPVVVRHRRLAILANVRALIG
jgi:hypothetical protein